MGCCLQSPSNSEKIETVQSNPASPNTNVPSTDSKDASMASGKTCTASLALEKYLEYQIPSKNDNSNIRSSSCTYEGGKDKILNDITMEVIDKDESINYEEEREITVFELIDMENRKLDQMIEEEEKKRNTVSPPPDTNSEEAEASTVIITSETSTKVHKNDNQSTQIHDEINNKSVEIVYSKSKSKSDHHITKEEPSSSSEDEWADSDENDEDTEDEESSLESAQINNQRATIMVTPPMEQELSHSVHSHSSIMDDRLDLNGSDQRLQYQIRMEVQETEEKFEKEKIKHKRTQTLKRQLNRHQDDDFDSLYKVFEEYATKNNQQRMHMEGLIKALSHFGMEIEKDSELEKSVFCQFDVDDNKEIDYNDFSSTLSMIVASKQEEKLELLFKLFDMDKDGYLELEDLARMLLTQNQIAVVATGVQAKCTVRYNKKQCLKQSKKLIASLNGTNNLDDGKITLKQFKVLMKDKTEKELMIEHMGLPSMSFDMDAPRVSGFV